MRSKRRTITLYILNGYKMICKQKNARKLTLVMKKIAFFDWVKDIYDPEKLQAEFLSSFWADNLVDKLLKRE